MINYIFPFDQVEKNSRIIIYGAGVIGSRYLEQIKVLAYCDCLYFVDRNYGKIQMKAGLNVYPIDRINNSTYDKIVIATRDESVRDTLLQMKVPEGKIVHSVVTEELSEFRHLPDPNNSPFWDAYYENAENGAKIQFDKFLYPLLSKYNDINFSNTLDFACGRGRMANIFSGFSKNITCCDINSTAIDFCESRFQNSTECTFHFHTNTRIGNTLESLDLSNQSFTFIYSWDAMVHFTYKWLDYYLKEFYRISSNNSYVLIHHSNYANVPLDGEKSEDWGSNPHMRTNIGKEDIRFLAEKHGFSVVEQQVIDWGIKDLDCISLLKVMRN